MIDWKLFETEFYYLGRVYRDNHQAVELIYNELKNKTYLYNPNILVVRRGSSFYIRYSRLDGKLVSLPSINIIIETQSKGNIARVSLSQENISESGFEFSVRKTSKNQYDIELNVDINASVGLYTLHLADDHQPVGHALTIYIVFNAFHALDCVYIDSVSLIKAYLFNTQLKVYCGSEDYHFGKPYNLDQFSLECTFVCGHFLNRMSLSERRDPVLVARAFSAYVNGNDDQGLMYGSWNEITEGTPPTAWTNALDIYKKYLMTGFPVKWGQCFVFSMLLTSMFRNLGMVSRSVSGFSIGHDNNKDGVLTIYLDNKTLKHLPNSETLWNFHAWTNVYIKRKDIEIIGISNNQMQISWQHADGTPQERSEGIYRCGPYPIRLLRKHIHKDIIPYDGTPVYYSINYTSKYILVGEDGVAITTSKKKDSCRLIITTGVNGKKIDITDEYKSTKKIIKDSMEEKKIKLTTKVPTASHLYSPMSYEISVKNASINEPTILSITVELLNIHGNKHTDHPVFFKSIVFQESEYIVSGITDPIDIKKPTDLSMSILKWEIECYDQSTNFITEIEKNTFVLPCFTGVLITTTGSLLMGKISIKLKIKNDLNIDVKNCKIETVAIGSREKQIINIESFLANSEREFSFSISITTPGSHVIESFMFSKYFNGKIAKKSIYILRNG